MIRNTDETLSGAERLKNAVLEKPQRAFKVDPECDLPSEIPWTHAERLGSDEPSRQGKRTTVLKCVSMPDCLSADEQIEIPKASGTASDANDTADQMNPFTGEDIRSFICPSEPISILERHTRYPRGMLKPHRSVIESTDCSRALLLFP